jgi:sigma-E factor negative regulatory protein RseC
MIEETGTIVSVEPGHAWVETRRQSTCSGCAARHGCGTATLAKVLGSRRTRLRVVAEMDIAPGDEVVLGLDEGALVRGSVAVYLVPLVLMIAMAIGAEDLFGSRSGSGEELALAGAVAGLTCGFAWLRLFGRRVRTDARYQAVLLRRTMPIEQTGVTQKSMTSGDLS